MARRRSIDIAGVAHGAPIPMGARIENIVYSSAIMGADPATGAVPDDPDAQVRLAFANLEVFLAAAGVGPDDVVRMTVLLGDRAVRDAVNAEWVRLFPDPNSRPARHTTVGPLAANMAVQLEIVAVAP